MADQENFAQTANSAKNISLVKQYELFLFPYETVFTAPTGVDWTPPTGTKAMGYSSEDGMTLHPEPGDTTDITAHNGDVVYSEAAPGFWTITFPGIELNQRAVEAYFDTTLDAKTGHFAVSKASTSRKWRAVVRLLDQDDNKGLLYAPKVQVSDREDLSFVYNKQVSPSLTLKTFKDALSQLEGWGIAKDFKPSQV